MTSICLFFQAHQPFRIKPYDFFQIGEEQDYFDHDFNKSALNNVCERSYIPTLKMFKKLHLETEGQFSFGLGISGSLLLQLEKHRPDVLTLFQEVVADGIAVLSGGTFSNSLATFFSAQEAARQILQHRKILSRLFEQRPTNFANTELIYRDDAVEMIHSLGYQSILAEGVPHYLEYRSPNYLYHTVTKEEVKLLLRNGSLSDDLGLRFSNQSWNEFPLTAEKFLDWCRNDEAPLLNLFNNIEAIGHYHGAETGVFNFWEALIKQAHSAGIVIESPSQATTRHTSQESYSSIKHSSWADEEKDKSAWQANVMQQEASQKLFRLEQNVLASHNEELIHSWTLLQSADNFMHISTKENAAGAFHNRFNPHEDPYTTYSYFMNILADLQLRSRVEMARYLAKEVKGLNL